jgi:hypothetical protein
MACVLEFWFDVRVCCGLLCSAVPDADGVAPASLLRAVRALNFSLSMEDPELKPEGRTVSAIQGKHGFKAW